MNLINKTFVTITDKIKGDSLKARCARSGVVLGIGAFIAKFLGFASKVILTRLLAPEAMGLMVLIISLTGLFEVFAEVGIKLSVIQNKKGAEREYLNMAWWFQSLRGVGLCGIAFLLAPWICEFYLYKPELLALHPNTEIVMMVRVAFFALLFYGLASPQVHVLEKEFQFGKSVLLKQGSGILGTIITIILVFFMHNVWAMIIGFVSSSLLFCLFSYIFCSFRPGFYFDRDSFVEIYRYARGMLGLPILVYIVFNLDVLVVGKLISADLLGMYGMALVLARAPQDLFYRIVSPVLLPAFAEKQNDYQALNKAIQKLTKVTTLIAIPAVVLTIIFSKGILSVVFGREYSVVAVPFCLMCISVLLIIQGAILGSIFFSLGKPEKQRSYNITCAVILAAVIYPAVKIIGLNGAALSVLAANFLALCVQVFILHRFIGIRIRNYLLSWLPGICLGLVILLPVLIKLTLDLL